MKNWKTTLMGSLMLALAGFAVYNNPAAISDTGVQGAIAGGVGLILAKDAAKKEEPAK